MFMITSVEYQPVNQITSHDYMRSCGVNIKTCRNKDEIWVHIQAGLTTKGCNLDDYLLCSQIVMKCTLKLYYKSFLLFAKKEKTGKLSTYICYKQIKDQTQPIIKQ